MPFVDMCVAMKEFRSRLNVPIAWYRKNCTRLSRTGLAMDTWLFLKQHYTEFSRITCARITDNNWENVRALIRELDDQHLPMDPELYDIADINASLVEVNKTGDVLDIIMTIKPKDQAPPAFYTEFCTRRTALAAVCKAAQQ
jgi:hypothetical protein